jgi:hypothetical protein
LFPKVLNAAEVLLAPHSDDVWNRPPASPHVLYLGSAQTKKKPGTAGTPRAGNKEHVKSAATVCCGENAAQRPFAPRRPVRPSQQISIGSCCSVRAQPVVGKSSTGGCVHPSHFNREGEKSLCVRYAKKESQM